VGIRVSQEAVGGDEPWEDPVDTMDVNIVGEDGEFTIYYQVRDALGRESDVYSVTFILDTANPFLESSEPVDMAEKVPVDGTFTLRFNEAMDTPSVEDAFTLSYEKDGTEAQVQGTFDWSTDGRTLTFTPAEDMEKGATLTLVITTEATDEAGNTMFPGVSYSYWTAGGDDGSGDNGGSDDGLPVLPLVAVLVVVGVVVALYFVKFRGTS
jgi:hypothetical protein